MGALNRNTAIGVVGAGAMGAGIAQVAALAGHAVLIYDTQAGAAQRAVGSIAAQLERLVEKGRLDASRKDQALNLLQPAESIERLANTSLVIEAIVENLEVKRELFARLEATCPADCILASNTSSLSITRIAATLKRPERVVGMHFFNPAPVMALVEVVSGLVTARAVAEQVYATALAWGKKPVHCRSTPGFIVNRVARPFYAESLRLLQENVADAATLDALMRDAGGFRMGAFELTDLIGHDVNYAVTCSVFEAYYNDMRFQPSLLQKELVDAGRLGRKSGWGFYDYSSHAAKPEVAELQSNLIPEECAAEGDLGPLTPLLERLRSKGVKVDQREGSGHIRIGNAVIALSDGRMACQRTQELRCNEVLLLDLALDFATTTRVGLSWSANTRRISIEQTVGLLQRAGLAVTPLADSPGLAVLRTVAMLANEAADAVLQAVASSADIDQAMCAGVNYPRGPLAWADILGLDRVLTVLEHLQAAYGEERYRPSLLLRKLALQGATFHA